jgi:hypothetical protein
MDVQRVKAGRENYLSLLMDLQEVMNIENLKNVREVLVWSMQTAA